VLVVVAFAAFLLLFQPILNLSPFRGLLEAQLTGLTGVPITLEELYMKPSLEPKVEVRDLRAKDLATVETAQLEIELIPLLKRHISIDSLKLDQVTVQLRPTLDAVRSWTGQDDRPKSPYRVDALENFEFNRVQLNVTDDLGIDHRLVIDECDGGITRESSLMLEARGSFDDEALHFEAGGPTLEEILAPDSTLPLEAALDIAGARLSLGGALTRQDNPPTLALEFGLEGDDLKTTLAAAGVRVPALGPFRLHGDLTHSEGPVHLAQLEGRVGETELSGDLQLSFVNDRLALEGSLDTGRIDLWPWLDLPPPADGLATQALGDQRIFDQPIPVKPIENVLTAMDADLALWIEGLEGLATTVEDLNGKLLLQDERLTLIYELQLAAAEVRAQTEIAIAGDSLELALDLSSGKFPLDQLSEDLGQGLTTGTVGQLRLVASSSGDTTGDLINQLVLEVESGDAQIRFSSPDKEKTVDLVLTQLQLRRGPALPVRIELDGDLRGYPYRIELAGQETKDWESTDPWPFKLTSEGLGGKTRIEGRVSFEPGDLFMDLELDVAGDRIGDLEPWWGVPAEANYSYEAHGSLTVEAEFLELRLDTLRVGQTTTTMTLLDPPQEDLPIQVDLQASTLALDELMDLIETEEKETGSDPALTLDIPIWPGELPIPDAQAHVQLEQVLRESEGLADLTDVVADVTIYQSHLERITFSARADEASYRGDLDLDWRTDPPAMNLVLAGEQADLGGLFPLEEIAPELVVRAQRFDLDVTGEAETLREMLHEGVTITGGAEAVYLSASLLDEDKPLELTLDQATISESPGRPIEVRADGHLWEWPIELDVDLHNKRRNDPEEDRIPVEMVLRAGDVRLEAGSDLTLPIARNNLDLEFSLTADRISSFEPFTGHRISEVGPVAASGDLAIRPDNFDLQDLSLEFGQSDAQGSVSLDLAGVRPRLSVDLSSQRVHIAELFANTWTINEDQDGTGEEEGVAESAPEGQEGESWLERLQSSTLARVDLDLNLKSEDIYWGSETGGGGRVQVHSKEGRLVVEPVHLALADGTVTGHADLVANSGVLDADMELLFYDVDYGPIARFLNPEAKGEGTIDIETRLVTTSAPVDQLITEADGDFRFALFPESLDTTLLNFWGAGLFRSMFRLVDPTDESVLNCMAGNFAVADGKLTANEFWFDTSRIRARGKGSIDLQQMTIDMTLKPRPKKRTFLTLATPAKIKGPVEDPKISLKKGGMVGTAFRIYMWWLTIYTQILKKPLPTDGSDVCFLPPPPETVDSPLGESTPPPGD
jgi:uncharacterized protein involved in outer membrane biogenesis